MEPPWSDPAAGFSLSIPVASVAYDLTRRNPVLGTEQKLTVMPPLPSGPAAEGQGSRYGPGAAWDPPMRLQLHPTTVCPKHGAPPGLDSHEMPC